MIDCKLSKVILLQTFGLTEPSQLAAKYIPQVNLTQVPTNKLQLIKQEIEHLTATLFPPLIEPYSKDKTPTQCQPTEVVILI